MAVSGPSWRARWLENEFKIFVRAAILDERAILKVSLKQRKVHRRIRANDYERRDMRARYYEGAIGHGYVYIRFEMRDTFN